MKKIIKFVIGKQRAQYLNNLRLLLTNFFNDGVLYFKHASLFSIDNDRKIECQIIIDYHSIEKGMLFKRMKERFAIDRVSRLHDNLGKYLDFYDISNKSQIKVGLKVLCKYYELHSALECDISDYFTEEQYFLYKKELGDDYDASFNGVIELSKEELYSQVHSEFLYFSSSRKSIRNFTDQKISKSKVEDAVKLSLNAPSVCNRQGAKIYYIDDKKKIEQILEIQSGMRGYSEGVHQLLILTQDRNFFYTVGERNQLYIDGGIFLMNLLYSLHYYNIAACPANWGKNKKDEEELDKVITIPKNEKIICIIPIGEALDKFNVTLSERRKLTEIFRCV